MKILMLAIDCNTSRYLFHQLEKKFPIGKVIYESPPSIIKFYRFRIKKLGWVNALGQFLFQVFQVILRRFSRSRLNEIETEFGLNDQPIPESKVTRVESINSPEVIKEIKSYQPDLVIVNGTGVIRKNVISECPLMLNIHVGITPKYRGVHGAYWAIVNQDREHCGVTVHEIDAGVDTGKVYFQSLIQPKKEDSIVTYPMLQYGVAIRGLLNLIRDFKKGEIQPVSPMSQESKQYFHPTLWSYLILWLRGIR